MTTIRPTRRGALQWLAAGAASLALPAFAQWPGKPIKITVTFPLTPEVPTVVEIGQPKLVLENFFGLSGPAKLPGDVVARLNAACNEVLVVPEVQKKMVELGIVGKPETTARFQSFVQEQVGVLGPTVKGAGVKL